MNGSVESYFTYQDSLRPIAQYNADGSIRWTIVYAERMNVPSLLISSNGTRYRVVSDHLGSVRLIINTLNGQIVQRMDYDVWGKVTYDSSPNFQPFGFAGGLYDSATELVRFGARDYDPYVGRWLSKDPIGFAGGDTNLYGYVIQDPVNWIDLNGQEKLEAILAVGPLDAWQANSDGLTARDAATNSGLSLRGEHNGQMDAYRHCVWTCLMTESIGADQARVIANIHEKAGNDRGQPSYEYNMDIFNNEVGMKCGVDRSKRHGTTCKEKCMSALKNNRLKFIELPF